ncbi:TMEM43 family protein [Thiotrichales bacterium HSG1]|nr:TMEM43 family protein [Thiotrichales bacterium HSG1]
MSYTEITTESWWSRIKKSFGNILLGLTLFLVAFPFLFWNEGRAVYRTQTLEEGVGIVTLIDAERIEKSNENKLIHLSGLTESHETLSDERFGIVQNNIIKLKRVVQMYQWQEETHSETEEEFGGSTKTTTTYSYSKNWDNTISNSSYFKHPEDHQNPDSMPFNSGTFQVKEVTIGAFTLSPSLLSRVNNYQKFPITEAIFERISKEHQEGLQIYNNLYYLGKNPEQPQIGDLKIWFEIVSPSTISIIAKQFGSTFESYITKVGGEIELFEYGTVSAEDMFKHEQEFNIMLTWLLRLAGFMIMFIGLKLIFNILRTLAAVVPFLADIVGFIGGWVGFIIAASFSLITIAIAWIFYRPLLGIALLVLAGGCLYFLKFAYKSQEDVIPITKIE